jgi:serine/threonine-protein kinase
VETALILGRYRPLAQIGEGGHGAVDLAFDTKMARRVAIKRIPLSHTGVKLLARTTGLKEARTAALLNHPNTVTVYEWDTDEDEAFLIMEHVDGASLAELLEGYAPLDADEAAAVLGPIADALVFAHDNGVLHLDLKPDNVLITRDGLVKVGDFGVASLTNAAGQAISAGGTLGYMPPEQLRGEAVDARTDTWAYAALAFEVLTGAVPFASDTIEGALFKAERTGVPAPGEFEPALPPEIDEILMAALSPEPADRPSHIEDLANHLLAFLGDPDAGRNGLRKLVAESVAELPPDETGSLARLGLWDRFAHRSGLAARFFVALASAYLAWAGMGPLGFGAAATVAAVAIAGVAGFVAARLGLAAGLILLAAGAFVAAPWLGVGVAVVGALWWIAVCRTRPAAGALPAFAPAAASLGLGAALPLLGGFFLDGVWGAGAAGLMSGLVLQLTRLWWRADSTLGILIAPLAVPAREASATPPVNVVHLISIVLAFGLAGVVSALGARRGTRLGAAIGSLAGLLVIAAASGPWVTGGTQLESGTAIQLLIALILMGAVIALGPPMQTADAPTTGRVDEHPH